MGMPIDCAARCPGPGRRDPAAVGGDRGFQPGPAGPAGPCRRAGTRKAAVGCCWWRRAVMVPLPVAGPRRDFAFLAERNLRGELGFWIGLGLAD